MERTNYLILFILFGEAISSTIAAYVCMCYWCIWLHFDSGTHDTQLQLIIINIQPVCNHLVKVSDCTHLILSSVFSSASTSVVSSSSATFIPADTNSTTKSGLESGAIAGVVIGCVIGSNLILLFCVWCCCLGGAVAGKNTQHKQLEESRVGGETYADQDEIEMESAA